MYPYKVMATNTEQRNLSQATAVSEIAVEEGLPYVTAAPMSAASTPPGTANPFNEDAVLSDKNLGTPIRRQGLSSRVLPGDWRCEHCDINNFASRTACFQCGAPPSGSTAEAIGNPTSGTSRSTGERKTNHWMCPNPNCGYR